MEMWSTTPSLGCVASCWRRSRVESATEQTRMMAVVSCRGRDRIQAGGGRRADTQDGGGELRTRGSMQVQPRWSLACWAAYKQGTITG
jgi:hypothetical protein